MADDVAFDLLQLVTGEKLAGQQIPRRLEGSVLVARLYNLIGVVLINAEPNVKHYGWLMVDVDHGSEKLGQAKLELVDLFAIVQARQGLHLS